MIGRLSELLAFGGVVCGLLLFVPMIFQAFSTAGIDSTKRIDRPIVRLAIPIDRQQLWIQNARSELVELNLETQRIEYTYRQQGEMITDWHVSRDGTILMVVSDDRKLRIFRNLELVVAEDLHETKSNKNENVAVESSLSSSGQTAIILSDFTAVNCWTISSDEITTSDFVLLNSAKRFAICPTGEKLIVSEEQGILREYDVKLGESVRTIAEISPATLAPVYSEDGHSLAVVCGKSLTLFDTQTGNVDWTFHVSNPEEILNLAFSPDGSVIAVGGLTVAIEILDCASGHSRQKIAPRSSTHRLAFSRSNNNLYGGCIDGTVRIWSALTGQEIAKFQPFLPSSSFTH